MKNFQLQSTQEFVFSVGDLNKTRHFYESYGGWRCIYEGTLDQSILKFWNLAPEAKAKEVLLQFEDNSKGQLRLIQFENIAQQYIRSAGQTWDTGGILDIDIRVNNIQQVYEEMREQGWLGISDPVEQHMGPFTLKEVLVKGHDEVIIALVDRIKPPIDLPKDKKLASNIYLSAMIVRDLAKARHFFIEQLGFTVMNEITIKHEAEQSNMFGLPQEVAAQHNINLALISPDGTREGMLDILEFEGLKGKDFSAMAVPPNRGILMYRFPVKNIEAYYAHLQNQGLAMTADLAEIVLQPQGKRKSFALQSPDGVWLEFFEAD